MLMESDIHLFPEEGKSASFVETKSVPLPPSFLDTDDVNEEIQGKLFSLARMEMGLFVACTLVVLAYGMIVEEKPVVVSDSPSIVSQKGYTASTIVDTPLDANAGSASKNSGMIPGQPAQTRPPSGVTPIYTEDGMVTDTSGVSPLHQEDMLPNPNETPRTPQSVLISVRERLFSWHSQTGSFLGYDSNDPEWQIFSSLYPHCSITPFVSVSPTGQMFEADMRAECGEVSWVYCIDATLLQPVTIPFHEVNAAMARYQCRAM